MAGSNNLGKRKHPDGESELVANTRNTRAKGKAPINLEEMLNRPCPEHSRPNKPARHTWGDCYTMQQFRDYVLQQHHGNINGPSGGSGPGGSGAGFGAGGSGSSYQGQGNHGGHNQQSGGGGQQQNNQSGYQSNPKQLSGGQYHVFTTSLDKRDWKVRKRAVNAVMPALPQYLKWSEYDITEQGGSPAAC